MARLIVSLAAALCLAAPSAAGAALPAADEQFVDQTVAQVMAQERIPGVSIGVWLPGRGSLVRSYGVRDLKSGAALRADDHVRIASITKTFTATAILQLVDQGRLRLKDKVDRWVEGVPNGSRITIQSLLAMRAGTYDFTMDEQFGRDFAADPLLPFAPRDVLSILARHKPLFAPGARTQYSDTNYTLLGIVLEKATGDSAESVIERQVVDRLGLRETSFPTKPKLPKPFARGYYAGDDGSGPLADYTGVNPKVAWTAGGMVSDLGDLRRWGKALARGALLSKDLRAKQLRFGRIPNPGGPPVGYGLGIFRIGDWIGHNGAIYGFNTITMYDRTTGAQIVAVANKSTNFSAEALDIFVPVAGRLLPESLS